MADDKNLKLSIPGEWALEKVLSPVLGSIGDDINSLYAISKKGASEIVLKAYNKIANKDDGKKANLRVARDVFWNGSFSDESICAEYFGGILASSRSDDGKDDNGIHYTDVIKSLSSKQLQLHYVVYNSLNKLLTKEDESVNVGQATELQQKSIWFSAIELAEQLKLKIDTDLNVLYKQGLLAEYKVDKSNLEDSRVFQYVMVKPTTFGVLLYAIAHNKFETWKQFSDNDFGNFEDVSLPRHFSNSLSNLLVDVGVKQEENK
jgi:hypothetical protein